MGVGALLGAGINNALGGQPVGTDFLSFYAVSTLIREGHASAAYDLEALHAAQQAIAGPDSPFYGWLYPPIALLVVAPLSMLPYGLSLVAWLVLTGAIYVSALRRILPQPRALLPILAFPGVFLTAGHGQNALLSAGILSWGLVVLAKNPSLGGALLGTLSFKPQLGLLLPVAFVASRNAKAFAAATLSVLALSGLSLLAFGTETWAAFLAQSGFAVDVLEEGGVAWEKMISAFAAARLVGLSAPVAWVLQAIVTAGAAALVWHVWHKPRPDAFRTAAIALGTLLATPFALDYEATFLGVAIAAMAADGLERRFLDWEKSALAILWVSPLLWRMSSIGTGVPFGLLVLVAAVALLLRRVRWSDRDEQESRAAGLVTM